MPITELMPVRSGNDCANTGVATHNAAARKYIFFIDIVLLKSSSFLEKKEYPQSDKALNEVFCGKLHLTKEQSTYEFIFIYINPSQNAGDVFGALPF
ncbi:hypothetical protein [Acetobacter pomorum]|uniref:hypothetical protein n=1 Tax=Acetobacter pomorum TaxID=65959 RepID=UPI001605F1C2|nr:hypothetical protein [Acetobacter pomorum]